MAWSLVLVMAAGNLRADQAMMTKPWKKHTVQAAEGRRGSINSAVAADFDGDGHVDIISAFNGHVQLYRGPSFKQRVTVFSFQTAEGKPKRTTCIHSTVMDVDGDGDPDFIGAMNPVFWLETPKKPLESKWTYRIVDDEIKGTHCLITGDVDRDGKRDLIANSFRDEKATSVPHSIAWLKVPAKPHVAKHWIRNVYAKGDAPGGSHYMGFGDVNGDGRPDIACGAKGGPGFPGGEWFAWWEQPKDPTQPWRKHLLADNQPGATNIHPVELNGDKHMDFFATRGHDKGVLWFKGPKFNPIMIDPNMDGPHCLATADLDGDGDMDAATCGRDATGIAVWYENNGQGKFARHVIGRDQGSYDLHSVDLDKDGDLDVLIAGHGSRNIVWYENPLRSK